jgi:hypothetical protein
MANYSVVVTDSVVIADSLLPFPDDVAFTSAPATLGRSVFTDKGPIVKPPVAVQQGIGVKVMSPTQIVLSGAAVSSSVVGLRLKLTGSRVGEFTILKVVAANEVRVPANYATPYATTTSLFDNTVNWYVVDPREGQIADSPLDVTVKINGVEVLPEAVFGLLGQVVLSSVPDPADDVKVSYRWIDNPTVEIRRLNSREFTLNNSRRQHKLTQHTYAYRCVLARPSTYVQAQPPQVGIGPIFTGPAQVTLPGAALTAAHVGLLLRLTGFNARTYRIVSVLSSTSCLVSPT